MLERRPIHKAEAIKFFIVPLDELQVVFDGMVAEPVNELVALNAGLALRGP